MPPISEHNIKMLLDREDIEGLLALGAPADEYQMEAQMIYRAATKIWTSEPQNFTIEFVTDVIKQVWEEMFGPFDSDELGAREPVFRKLAMEICGGIIIVR